MDDFLFCFFYINSANKDHFISSYRTCIFFPCLIELDRTSSTILNRRDEKINLTLFPILVGKESFNLLPSIVWRLLEVSNDSCLLSGGGPLISSFLKFFYYEWTLKFVKCFLCNCWNDHMVLICCVLFLVVDMIYIQ